MAFDQLVVNSCTCCNDGLLINTQISADKLNGFL